MKTVRIPARGIALAILPALLAGCVTLLPKSPPAQLYRFGAFDEVGPARASLARFTVRVAPINFETAAAGDEILTSDGDKIAYIGGARWVTSAPALFEAAVSRSFDARSSQARLLARGEITHADYLLKLDVRRFEVRYDHGSGGAPTIKLEIFAALDNPVDPTQDRARLFSSSIQAEDNRVGAIVRAFDTAVGAVLTDLVGWTDAKGAG